MSAGDGTQLQYKNVAENPGADVRKNWSRRHALLTIPGVVQDASLYDLFKEHTPQQELTPPRKIFKVGSPDKPSSPTAPASSPHSSSASNWKPHDVAAELQQMPLNMVCSNVLVCQPFISSSPTPFCCQKIRSAEVDFRLFGFPILAPHVCLKPEVAFWVRQGQAKA